MPEVTLDELKTAPVTAIVSLGEACGVAHNLRRHFNFKSAYPFDWWVTPQKAVTGLLARPDIDYLYDPALLTVPESRATVTHAELGLLFHHEFPRDWKTPGGPISQDYLDHIEAPKARTRYLLDKFLKLDRVDARVLFVRMLQAGEDPTAVRDALASRFGRATWAFAAIAPIRSDPSFGWQGDAEAWNRVLSDIDISSEESVGAPFNHVEPGLALYQDKE